MAQYRVAGGVFPGKRESKNRATRLAASGRMFGVGELRETVTNRLIVIN